MNERIRQLAEQAVRYALDKANEGEDEDYEYSFDDDFQEKFAQLIVLECARKIEEMIDNGWYADTEQLKKHFEIEERKGWVCPKCGVDRTRDVCPKGHTAAITGDCPMIAEAQ